MINIDWSKAPEGAMCYVHEWGFFKCEHGEWWVSHGAGWQRTPYKSPENFSWFCAVVWRNKPWTGTGLPPVGTVCRIPDNASCGNDFLKQFEGLEIKIIAHNLSKNGTEVAVFRYEASNGAERYHALCDNPDFPNFEPIRTPEHIAAEERKAAIDAMSDVTQGAHNWLEAFGMLHDAGLRFKDDAQ